MNEDIFLKIPFNPYLLCSSITVMKVGEREILFVSQYLEENTLTLEIISNTGKYFTSTVPDFYIILVSQ